MGTSVINLLYIFYFTPGWSLSFSMLIFPGFMVVPVNVSLVTLWAKYVFLYICAFRQDISLIIVNSVINYFLV